MKLNPKGYTYQCAAAVHGTRPSEDLFTRYMRLDAKQRQEHFVTTEQAAALANVSRRTVQHWIAEGHVRAVRVAYATISSGPP